MCSELAHPRGTGRARNAGTGPETKGEQKAAAAPTHTGIPGGVSPCWESQLPWGQELWEARGGILGYPWCSVGSKSPLKAHGAAPYPSGMLWEKGDIPWKSSWMEVKTRRAFPNHTQQEEK